MAHPTNRFVRRLPELMVALWCLFIGIAVWQHVQRSEQPPIHDAQTYFQKAQNFWGAIDERKWVNPLNLEPTFRPPGTVLMSYPFGFNIDFRGFYFRSILWPVLLLALAAYIAAWARRKEERSNRNLALAAIFITTFPSIYQFELTADGLVASHFGLVDNFLMGLAALAVGASMRSLQTCSLAWVAVAATIASLCLLVKPSGAYVMALVGTNWLLLALAQLRQARRSTQGRDARQIQAWVLKGLGIFAVLYLATLGVSLSSQYLSPQNVAFGAGAIAIMQSDWTLVPGALQALIRTSIGYALPAVALAIIVLGLANRRRAPPSPAISQHVSKNGMALAAVATIAFGIWFWFFGSGGLFAARYFVPFAAMAAIYGLPVALDTLERSPQWQTRCLQLLCVLPVLNLALLLVQINPSDTWQRWSGVNLRSGLPNPVMNQARTFLKHAAAGGTSVSLYAMPLGLTDSTFQAVADHHRAANPGSPAITIRRPIDWIRSSTYRLTEILGSDFILLEPVSDLHLRTKINTKPSIDSFEEERLLLMAWATELKPDDGVSIISETPSARLLRIDDRARLESSLSRLEARHRWRDIFLTANPRRWWNQGDLARELAGNPTDLSDARFGNRFHVRALSVKSTDVEITVKLWWEQIEATAGGNWFFFVHALGSDGKIMLNNQIRLADWMPARVDENIRFDVLTFRKPPYRAVAALGVGVYRAGDGQILPADTGQRDWNNTRVILPVR